METAGASADGVEVPSNQAKAFMTGVRHHGHEGDEEKVVQIWIWMVKLEQSHNLHHTSLGNFLGGDVTYFFRGEREGKGGRFVFVR